MSQGVQDLLQAALALSDEEQRQLMTALMAAADERGISMPDDDWMAEIRRRSDEYEAGGAKTVPWSEVKARAWQKVSDRG